MSCWTPTTYKTRNWAEYNLSLKQRGSLSVWFDPEMSWEAEASGRRGRQQAVSAKSQKPKAKAALHDIWQAETKVDAEKAFDLFIKTYEPKYPKATLCLQKDREELMAFFDFPAQHWQTEALGGRVAACTRCSHLHITYNSCKNRHCPKCQGPAARAWMQARADDLLPVEYFHVVFTLPAEVARIAHWNKKAIYGLLFKASAKTVTTIAADRSISNAMRRTRH
jgi:hypothetical protein